MIIRALNDFDNNLVFVLFFISEFENQTRIVLLFKAIYLIDCDITHFAFKRM